ncbi:MAG TPA: response regulator transcription factor, partial [Abditibacterium sp.]
MAIKSHILVIEDDKQTGQSLVTQLQEAGYSTSVVNSTQTALNKLREARPDAIVLGLNAQNGDDEFLRTLRSEGDYATNAPIIVLAPKGGEGEAVAAISTGADDFLVKPIRSAELAARLQVALLRNKSSEAPSRAVALRAGPIFLNADRREVYLRFENGEIRPLSLTKREFALLRAMMSRKNQMMSRRQLVDEAFGEGAPVDPLNLGAYIHRLR